jgi:predicted nucleic-acid-binding Zn-ribbon protein
MKTKRLICPKCGNTEKFRVDVELQYASTSIEFGETAELDVSFPNDYDIMCAICEVCESDIRTVWHEATPDVMCSHCKHYVEGELLETCPHKEDYPACFEWEDDIELDLLT